MASDVETRLRQAAMEWLDERADAHHHLVDYAHLASFVFGRDRVPLLDKQKGIRKPRMLEAALSIRTSFTPPGQTPPYRDAQGQDGLLRYKYRGDNPDHPENVSLRLAWQQQLPIIWFFAVTPGKYQPIYPVWIVDDEPQHLQFVLAVDEAQRFVPRGQAQTEDQRRYSQRLTERRLHQPVFRARVVHAYDTHCAICRLAHAELLDAAHILPDGHPRGLPIVPNGLSLCKIHHAAFDQDILGVRPDLIVEVRRDILDEIDGPMLRHGLQEMNGIRLLVPRARAARPSSDAIEERYERFRAAG